jgi:hypothetical protein
VIVLRLACNEMSVVEGSRFNDLCPLSISLVDKPREPIYPTEDCTNINITLLLIYGIPADWKPSFSLPQLNVTLEVYWHFTT